MLWDVIHSHLWDIIYRHLWDAEWYPDLGLQQMPDAAWENIFTQHLGNTLGRKQQKKGLKKEALPPHPLFAGAEMITQCKQRRA